MLKWILLMPIIWLSDYLYGIINPYFREYYISVQENLVEYMQGEEEKLRKLKGRKEKFDKLIKLSQEMGLYEESEE